MVSYGPSNMRENTRLISVQVFKVLKGRNDGFRNVLAN
jgi:hypothetical protein